MQPSTPPVLRIEHLSKRFGADQVLDDISLTADRGDVIALLGQSGSGKSTLLRCINLLTVPDAGDIYINGELIALHHRRNSSERIPNSMQQVQRLRCNLAKVFQQFNLWSHLTVLENVTLAPIHVLKRSKTEAIANAKALLSKVGLADKLHHYPIQLSGGQQQRAAIARALAMEPTALLFDEPTSALDPEMVSEVLGVIQQLAKEGKTMIVATHEMSFAREVSTKVVFLNKGKIDCEGTPQALFNHPPTARFQQFMNAVL